MAAREFRPTAASGRERFGIGTLVIGHRLELVVTGLAMPEIGDAARTGFNPFRRGYRLATLGAGIFEGQIAEIRFGHEASPFCFLLLMRIGQDCCRIPTLGAEIYTASNESFERQSIPSHSLEGEGCLLYTSPSPRD